MLSNQPSTAQRISLAPSAATRKLQQRPGGLQQPAPGLEQRKQAFIRGLGRSSDGEGIRVFLEPSEIADLRSFPAAAEAWSSAAVGPFAADNALLTLFALSAPLMRRCFALGERSARPANGIV